MNKNIELPLPHFDGQILNKGVCCTSVLYLFEEFVGLKSKMYSFFIDGSSEDKRAKGMNKTVVATSHVEYKDIKLSKIQVKIIQ